MLCRSGTRAFLAAGCVLRGLFAAEKGEVVAQFTRYQAKAKQIEAADMADLSTWTRRKRQLEVPSTSRKRVYLPARFSLSVQASSGCRSSQSVPGQGQFEAPDLST
jgi:hypothetical protein